MKKIYHLHKNQDKSQISENKSNNFFGKVTRACGINKAASSFYINIVQPLSSGVWKIFVRNVETLEARKEILMQLAKNLPDIDNDIHQKIVDVIDSWGGDNLEMSKFLEIEKLLKDKGEVFQIVSKESDAVDEDINVIFANAKSIVTCKLAKESLKVEEGEIQLTIKEMGQGGEVDLSEFKGEVEIREGINCKLKVGPGVTKLTIKEIGPGGEVDLSEFKGEVEISWCVYGKLKVGPGVTKLTIKEIGPEGEVDLSEFKGEVKIMWGVYGKLKVGPGVTKLAIDQILQGGEVDLSEFKGEVEIRDGVTTKLKVGPSVKKLTIEGIGPKGEVDLSEFKGEVEIRRLVYGKLKVGAEVQKIIIPAISHLRDNEEVSEKILKAFREAVNSNQSINNFYAIIEILESEGWNTSINVDIIDEIVKLSTQDTLKLEFQSEDMEILAENPIFIGIRTKLEFLIDMSFTELCNKHGDFKISEKYRISRKMIDKGPDPTMKEWNVDFGLYVEDKKFSEEEWNEKWEEAQMKLVSMALKFDDKIKVSQEILTSTLVQNFFALVLQVKDAKTPMGKEYVRRRVCGLAEYIGKLETNPKEKDYIGEKGMEHLGQIIELFADGAMACPDRAIVFLEKVEVEVKLVKAPECLFNILFNNFKRQMIELTFMNVKNRENIETILYELNRFNELLGLGARASMLYGDIAYKMRFGVAAKKLLETFNKDAIVTFFSQLPQVRIFFGVDEKQLEVNKGGFLKHFEELQRWALDGDKISEEKLRGFIEFFGRKYPAMKIKSEEGLKKLIEEDDDKITSECQELWNDVFRDRADAVHKDEAFKPKVEVGSGDVSEDMLFGELAKAGILEEIGNVKVELSMEEGKEDIEEK